MDLSPVEKVQRNNREGWEWNGDLLPDSARPATFRQISIPRRLNGLVQSLAEGSAWNDRPLVPKVGNVLNFLLRSLQSLDNPNYHPREIYEGECGSVTTPKVGECHRVVNTT
jgi:hypothetical protein